MSHQVQIDYQGIAIQCESICEVAEKRLAELDEMLERAKQTSSSLMKDRAVALAAAIEQEKKNLIGKISALKQKAESIGKRGVVHVDSDRTDYRHRFDIINEANDLQQVIDRLSSERLIEFQSLLQTLLCESIDENQRKLREQNSGVITVDSHTKALLNGIQDEVLRQFIGHDYENHKAKAATCAEAGWEAYQTC